MVSAGVLLLGLNPASYKGCVLSLVLGLPGLRGLLGVYCESGGGLQQWGGPELAVPAPCLMGIEAEDGFCRCVLHGFVL